MLLEPTHVLCSEVFVPINNQLIKARYNITTTTLQNKINCTLCRYLSLSLLGGKQILSKFDKKCQAPLIKMKEFHIRFAGGISGSLSTLGFTRKKTHIFFYNNPTIWRIHATLAYPLTFPLKRSLEIMHGKTSPPCQFENLFFTVVSQSTT